MIDYGSGSLEYYTIKETGGMVFVKQVEVLLNAPERALRFCNILSACEGPFDLGRGSYTVDGKSILGICTMDLTVPLTLSIYDETENVLEKIRGVSGVNSGCGAGFFCL